MARRRISNEMITWMVIALVIISIIGFLPFLGPGITGAQSTQRANVTLDISETVGCDFIDDSIDFSSMTQNEQKSSRTTGDNWTLQNTGTVNITVNISTDTDDSDGWLFSSQQVASNYWYYRCINALSGSCNITANAQIRFVSNEWALYNLTPFSSEDNVTLQTNVTVPGEEGSGSKTGAVRAECYKAV